MRISEALLKAAGRPDLVEEEVQATSDYDFIMDTSWRRSKALLERKKLWPVPRTRKALEAALKRRLGRPRGRKSPRPRKRQADLLEMFATEVMSQATLQ